MSNSIFNKTADQTIKNFSDDNSDGRNDITFELTDNERLCFDCSLDDCHEESRKCLIKIAKSK